MSHSRKQPAERYSFPDTSRLWHSEGEQTRSLGCMQCAFKEDCGGLSVSAGIYDCASLCRCVDPAKCTKVCPNNTTRLVQAMKEVRGLSLATTPRVRPLLSTELPTTVPLIYHPSKRMQSLDATTVALSLYRTLDKKAGILRYSTPESLRAAFKLHADTRIVLSGTDTDPPLERVWGLPDRKAFFRALANLGIELVTTPNYSLICDNPRLDDLHNMKRIAIAHAEALEAGLPAALHINGRTEFDYERWAKQIDERHEIEWIAFEFGTGAGRSTRMQFHLKQLIALAKFVTRPLRLIMRGGMGELPQLAPHFGQVALIDTSAFIKTHKRQRAVLVAGKLEWQAAPTAQDELLDELLAHNVGAVAASVDALLQWSSDACSGEQAMLAMNP